MRHLLLVLSEPIAGREAEFYDWYEHTHLDEVLATAGYTRAQRFELRDAQGVPCPLPHLAVYEIDTDDPSTVLPALNATRNRRRQSPAFNRVAAGAWVFAPLGPPHARAADTEHDAT